MAKDPKPAPLLADPAECHAELGAENPGPVAQVILERIQGWTDAQWDDQIHWDEASRLNGEALAAGGVTEGVRPFVRPALRYSHVDAS